MATFNLKSFNDSLSNIIKSVNKDLDTLIIVTSVKHHNKVNELDDNYVEVKLSAKGRNRSIYYTYENDDPKKYILLDLDSANEKHRIYEDHRTLYACVYNACR